VSYFWWHRKNGLKLTQSLSYGHQILEYESDELAQQQSQRKAQLSQNWKLSEWPANATRSDHVLDSVFEASTRRVPRIHIRCVAETHLPSSHSIALQIMQANGIISGKYCNWGKQSKEKVVLIIWWVFDGANAKDAVRICPQVGSNYRLSQNDPTSWH
jgi:hypothetical protein